VAESVQILIHAASVLWYTELICLHCRFQHAVSLAKRAKHDWRAAKAQLRALYPDINAGRSAMEAMSDTVRAAAQSKSRVSAEG
jgi:hypothetical protein